MSSELNIESLDAHHWASDYHKHHANDFDMLVSYFANFWAAVNDPLKRKIQNLQAENDELSKPIPMVLHCPKCHEQHIDTKTEKWDNPPHRSHLCEYCGCIWRPCDRSTTGVESILTIGKDDNFICGDLITASPNVMTKHIHAELMEQYAEDATETDRPWERWEFKNEQQHWTPFTVSHPSWHADFQYRRKEPKTKEVVAVYFKLPNGEIVTAVAGSDYEDAMIMRKYEEVVIKEEQGDES